MSRSGDLSPQPALLGLLMSHPKHGYELYQEFSRELGSVWQIGQSQLYAQLKQLEQEELVTVQIEPQPNRELSLPGLDRLVAEQKAVCRAQIEVFDSAAAETDDAFRRLVLEFRQGQLRAVIQWLDRCLEIA
jgi:hypothetical protein